ncbi:MAG: hypothetical protein Q7R95_04615 [bacterium]|nr:hypothetical protein [bacterium]
MITQKDIEKLKTIFATKLEMKVEINSLRKELKNDILEFKDAILHEILNLRDDIAITLGHRNMLEDHENRILNLEKHNIVH